MLECGVPIARIKAAMGWDFSRLDGCLVSHSHGDHCRAAADVARLGVDVWASGGALAELGLSGRRFRTAAAGRLERIGGWRVLPFPAVHDAPEPLGFAMRAPGGEALAFLTDSAYSEHAFAGLDFLLAECNHDRDSLDASLESGEIDAARRLRVMRNHFSLEGCVGFALACRKLSPGLRRIVLLHPSGQNADEALMVRRMQEATGIAAEMAAPGAKICL
jgi:phosphoribosyl 1,2-cyclic phosphodiesterase